MPARKPSPLINFTVQCFLLRQAERVLAWLQGIFEVDRGPLWFWFYGYPAIQPAWQRMICRAALLIDGWYMMVLDKQLLYKEQSQAHLISQIRDPRLRKVIEQYEAESRGERE